MPVKYVSGFSFPSGFPDYLNTLGVSTLGQSNPTNLNTASKLSPSFMATAPDSNEVFSRKVFVGGLPPDIDEGTVNL